VRNLKIGDMKKHDYAKSNVLDVIKNIAVYLRKSRDEGAEDLERHRSVIVEYCKHYDWNYVEYAEIVSGENIKNRPKMKELLKDVEDEMYDAVFVYDYDRLGRGNGADQYKIIQTFKTADTLVILANPFNVLDPNDERDETMIDFKGFMANQEYKMIRKRLLAGKKISLKMGHWANGYAPYGYEINKDLKKLSVIAEQKEVIRKYILEPYLSGKSSLSIEDNLKNLKVLTNKGHNWNVKAILYALTNKTYLGHTYYNRRDRKGIEKPENEWSVTLNTHEAIMTEEELETVLEIKNKRHTTGKKTVNALGSLIRCANCNGSMRIRKDSGTRKVYKCTSCNENKGGLLEIVEDSVLLSLQTLRKQLEKGNVFDAKENKSDEIQKEIEKILKEIRKVEDAITQIDIAFENKLYTVEKAMTRTKERQNEITELQKLLRKEKVKLSKSSNPSDISLNIVERILHEIEYGEDEKQLKFLYDDIFEKIVWERYKWDQIKVKVHFK
jgi:DNA invertase Pin-like site-specific DNA recombinase